MPLKRGYSQKTVASNAHEMMAAGHTEDQAWAAAYDNARRSAHSILGYNPGHLKKRRGK